MRRVKASVLRTILGSPFDTASTTELPTGNLKTGKLGIVIYSVEIVDRLLSKISNYRASVNCPQDS